MIKVNKQIRTMILSTAVMLISLVFLRDCPLCREKNCHAPCLVNLKTGEYAELVVYDDRFLDLYGRKDEGVYYYLKKAGADIYLFTMDESTTAYVSKRRSEVHPIAFCWSCRKKLCKFQEDGYVLASCYDGEPLTFYPVEEGAKYKIRCYTVAVEWDEHFRKMKIVVNGCR